MKFAHEIIIWSAGIFFWILISILTREYPLPSPVALQIGGLVTGVIAMLRCSWEILRGKSPVGISIIGKWSINAKEIKHIPWHSDILKNTNIKEELTIWFMGGINYGGINPSSGAESPVWIFPRRYEIIEGENYHCYAYLFKRESIDYLDQNVRNYLKHNFPTRVTKNTPIFSGYTSHLDGSATPENLKIEFTKAEENKYINELEDRNNKLYEQLRKADEHKSKKVIVGKEIATEEKA